MSFRKIKCLLFLHGLPWDVFKQCKALYSLVLMGYCLVVAGQQSACTLVYCHCIFRSVSNAKYSALRKAKKLQV